MASSVGRIALGVVGAIIGAPFGLSAVGFAIGSAIGGAIFAPEGPNVEGPRLGDTTVSASSLGKVIPEHYGVTRTSGNVIWSAGLKEIKKEESNGGGGKGGGGGGGTTTTYEYYASFATALGRGPAKEVRKIWADGKLIYDGTGDSETDNSKYTWRLRKGAADEGIDPLIAESIHRRLAGMADVNKGNQEQAVYTTINDLITQAQAGTDGRSQLYATGLAQLKAEAETGLEDGGVPDYGFTPAYRGIAMLVFDDMKLEDFGNRIPNITVEVVWEGATSGNGADGGDEVDPTGVDVTQIASTAVPEGLMAVDPFGKKLFTHAGNTVRRFSAEGRNEDRQKAVSADGAPPEDWTETVWDPNEGRDGDYVLVPAAADYGWTINKFLCALPSGNVLAAGSRKKEGWADNFDEVVPTVFALSGAGIEPIGPTGSGKYANAEFGTMVNIPGNYPNWLQVREADRGDSGTVQTDGATGDHFAVVAGTTISAARLHEGVVTDETSITAPSSANILFFQNNGPMVSGGVGGNGDADFYLSKWSSNALWIGRYRLTNHAIKNGNGQNYVLQITNTDSVAIPNPFGSSITAISAMIRNPGTDEVFLLVSLSNGQSGIIEFTENLDKGYHQSIPAAAPAPDSGLSRSDVTNGTLAFADGTDIIEIAMIDGSHKVYSDILSNSASNKAQAYFAEIAGLFLWEGGQPRIYTVGTIGGSSRDHDIAATLPEVIRSICDRAGMASDEFDVSGVSDHPVRGYTIARQSSGRQALENLMQAFFVDGIETDWKVVFKDRSTDSVRTIDEDELGEVSSPTGKVNWLESRTPEYELPAEINLNFSDPVRDYQTSTAHKRRIANPIPSMYSHTVKNVELPLVMKEHEAQSTAERLLYLSWMSRDSAKSVLNWTHADLDPGDVITVRFKDGRIVTDRVAKATLGANFEIETETVRSGDPVYDPAPQTIIPTGSIPTVNSPIPVSSEMFVFDIPLLFDYHETGRAVARHYTAVGSESDNWTSATIFKSIDGASYLAGDTVALDVTWGSVLGTLQRPRALWTTDRDNKLRIAVAKDKGNLVSVTREEILNGANRALVYNRDTGIGEIIQFQNVSIEDNGATFVLSDLTRGCRGTEYAADKHTAGEVFILLNETDIQVSTTELELLGSTAYFKAVSAGQIITGVSPQSRRFVGRSLMPYAPSRVRRADSGGDLVISWNRRTRVGGGWDMLNNIETVPLSEDFESYELYLLPSVANALDNFSPTDPTSYLEKRGVNATSSTFTAAELSAHGLTLDDDIYVCVYQLSGQVGRGFPALGKLAP
ncbi:hypothetical protein MAL1_00082 [Bacteriophage DSS3_MAL1]|nr:hypothetical protein MAL1_00082 [Bacteriophage DSS3_MAL1]